MPERKIPVLFGATASGKTELSLALAKAIDGHIINMDSLQIYKDLSIGTAKPTAKERSLVPHHLFDFLDPTEEFSVAQYQEAALTKIDEILSKGATPIFVGGTGLYLSSLYYDFTFREKREREEEFQKLLDELGEEGIVAKLKEYGVEGLDKVDTRNPHRLFRVWQSREVHPSGERTRSSLPLVIFHLRQPREVLHQRIAQRTQKMLEEGLIQEVQQLLDAGLHDSHPAMKGIGYRETCQFIRGQITRDELEEKIIVSTRQYAKRQLTWIRNQYPDVQDLDATCPTEILVGIIQRFIKESS
ncbi:MAG TPA: tRNA (adenosine(37)-N6)-dimethylallyltransferase MiaA [Tissierellia bacterium]|nr:tRNA (adenosine(37)-N6)-dimethylallyltransferase MiaA [Tissierellia bacterium]